MGNGHGKSTNIGNGIFYFSHTFMGIRNGNHAVYHWIMSQKPECGLWDIDPDAEIVGFWCRVDAEKAGFEPCPHCNGLVNSDCLPARVRNDGECDEICREGVDCRDISPTQG